MTKILSTTEAKELLRLCKTGRLFEIQNWIASGKSICVPADSRTTPLEVALDTGFHSLVELLVRNERSQELKNDGLQGSPRSFVTFSTTAPTSLQTLHLHLPSAKKFEPPFVRGGSVERNIRILLHSSKSRLIGRCGISASRGTSSG